MTATAINCQEQAQRQMHADNDSSSRSAKHPFTVKGREMSWTQASDSAQTRERVDDYKLLASNDENFWFCGNFAGLSQSNNELCFIDGNPGRKKWHFLIGQPKTEFPAANVHYQTIRRAGRVHGEAARCVQHVLGAALDPRASLAKCVML